MTEHCDHKFVDSTRCLKCGWTPEITTLQLARRVADAAVIAFERADRRNGSHVDDLPDHEHPPTQAVLRVLRETDSWFCRLPRDANGHQPQAGQVPYEDVQQQELFR